MNNNELATISKLLKRFKETQPMTTSEDKALTTLLLEIETKKVVNDCRDFIEYLDSELSVLDTGDEESIERFYNKDITIGFGHRTVTIYNNADTFQYVQDLLKDFVDDYKNY